ncbi:MAG: type II toxin-antitoxin system VapC family toxin [Bacteroidetes bacterium]|nr:type II toxin-antitoxin system VapC family toxin [Bacteroidota bacterium]MCW5897280.1 type II toxin-antitoxin system VapC family toxin [Bacteroidota bacterium]
MKLLLDTHALIWFLQDDERLTAEAKKAIQTSGNVSFVSLASMWEMAIKSSLGKLKIEVPFGEIPNSVRKSGLEMLDIRFEHIETVSGMPFFHRDPFDRILIAQAIFSRLSLVSNESVFEQYGIERIW